VVAERAAYDAGFNDYSTFFRAYKGYYGTAPVRRGGGRGGRGAAARDDL